MVLYNFHFHTQAAFIISHFAYAGTERQTGIQTNKHTYIQIHTLFWKPGMCPRLI